MAAYLRLVQRLGWKGAAEHIYMFRRVKEGTLVGVDALGNKYWENRDLPHGQDRWWEPPVYEAQQLQEASAVTPEWHGWLHHTTDVVPKTNAPKRTGVAIVARSDAPGDHNVPESVRNAQWRPNPTMVRERGYGTGTYYSKPGENGFYTQPGSPLSPLHKPFVPTKVAQRYVPTDPPNAKTPVDDAGEDLVFERGKKLPADHDKWKKFAAIRAKMA